MPGGYEITLTEASQRIAILHSNYLEYFFSLGVPVIASAGTSVGTAQQHWIPMKHWLPQHLWPFGHEINRRKIGEDNTGGNFNTIYFVRNFLY
jgi:hypothetical protein